jgi:hypothetical protein
MITCPDCGGRRGAYACIDYADGRASNGWHACHLCGATGEISDERAASLDVGRRYRLARVARGEGLRECARRLGISGAHLSRIERGLAEPVEGME